MQKLRLYQVDSFTTTKFKGNPAGVVANADGLSDRQMQAIARELNNSETVFILRSDGADHDVRLRFFTPTVEVPSCGHATIAAHYVRAMELGIVRSTTVMQKTGIGTLPVAIMVEDQDYQIFMTQAEPEFEPPLLNSERAALLEALGVNQNQLMTRAPIQTVSTGHSKVLVPLKSLAFLNAVRPDFQALNRVSRMVGCNGFFLFTLDSDEPDILTHARMFAPAIGIQEDPVTGNGNGPLGAYLVHHKLTNSDGRCFRFRSLQGEAIGRPGIAQVKVGIDAGKPCCVKVGGSAAIVFRTELEIDCEKH